jgi:hypothetical protein
MARQKNDGKGRMGGRKPGTPNKSTVLNGELVQCLLDENYERAKNFLAEIDDPNDFWRVYLKLMEFRLPKMSSIDITDGGAKPDWMAKMKELTTVKK